MRSSRCCSKYVLRAAADVDVDAPAGRDAPMEDAARELDIVGVGVVESKFMSAQCSCRRRRRDSLRLRSVSRVNGSFRACAFCLCLVPGSDAPSLQNPLITRHATVREIKCGAQLFREFGGEGPPKLEPNLGDFLQWGSFRRGGQAQV